LAEEAQPSELHPQGPTHKTAEALAPSPADFLKELAVGFLNAESHAYTIRHSYHSVRKIYKYARSPAANLTDNPLRQHYYPDSNVRETTLCPYFLLLEELGEKSQPPPVDLAGSRLEGCEKLFNLRTERHADSPEEKYNQTSTINPTLCPGTQY
jgi:hypothetical protein